MKRKRFSEVQIIGILKEAEAGGKKQDLYRKHGSTFSSHLRKNWLEQINLLLLTLPR